MYGITIGPNYIAELEEKRGDEEEKRERKGNRKGEKGGKKKILDETNPHVVNIARYISNPVTP